METVAYTIAPTLVAYFDCMTHCWNVTSLSDFNKFYFSKFFWELAELVPFPYSCGRCTCYFNRLHDRFMSPFLDVIKMPMLTVYLLAQLEMWIMCWTLILEFGGTFFMFGFSLIWILISFRFSFSSYTCSSMLCSDYSALCGANTNWKKKKNALVYRYT